MEHGLHDYDNLNIIRGTEDEGDALDSTTLLHPSEGEARLTNNGIISEAYNATMSSRRNFDSEDDLYAHLMSFWVDMFTNVLLSQPPAKHKYPSLQVFIRPITACSWQFIVLLTMIAFITRTESTAYPIVPRRLATLYVKYPQGSTTAITLVGSLLSLLSTKYVSGSQSQVVGC